MYQKEDLKSFDVFSKNITECIDKLDEKSSVSFDFAYPCYNIKTGFKDYAKHSIIFTFADKTQKSFEFLSDDKMEELINSNQYMLSVLIQCKMHGAHITGTFQKGKYSKFDDIYRQIYDYCYGLMVDKIAIEDLEDENFTLKDKVDELEEENKNQQKEIDDLKAEVDNLQDKYSSLEERVAELEKMFE